MEQPEKKCNSCGVSKPQTAENFYFHNTRKSFSGQCKECIRTRARAKYENDPEHREKLLALQHSQEVRDKKSKRLRERRANDPEYRESQNQRKRERWANDDEYRDKVSSQNRNRYAATHTERECAWCEATKPKEEFPNQAGIQVCHACRENPPAERKCNLCEMLKPSSEFEKGHGRNQCKQCRKELRQQRIDGRANTEWECRGCNQVKPASDFQGDARVCRSCVNANRRERRENDPALAAQQRAQKRQAYAANPEPAKQYGRERWAQTSRPCAVCGQPKLPKDFVMYRQLCQECFDSPYRKCLSCGEQKPAERFLEQALQCVDCQNSAAYKWRHENPEKVQESRLRNRFGLSKAEKEAMELAQGGLCAICRQGKKLVIDHSHESSAVRGLLCQDCNVGLGYFGEEESLFLSAIKYLHQPGLVPADIKPITDDDLFSRFEIPNWEAQSRDKAFRSHKNSSLKKRYGITIDQYESLLAQRDGVCWICARPQTSKLANAKYPNSLYVDHSHSSGLIRGLLCLNCNLGVGAFKDDAERIEQAVQYLAQRTTSDIGD